MIVTPSDQTRLDAQLQRLHLHYIQNHCQALATKAAEQQHSHLDYLARLVEGENVLRVHAIFGEVKLTIPEGMDVTIHSTAQFGDVSTPRQWGRWGETGGRAPATSAPSTVGRRLHIYATATFGHVSIRTV